MTRSDDDPSDEYAALVLAQGAIEGLRDSLVGDYEAKECLRSLEHRGIYRHHSLADALALRAGYLGATRGR